MARSDKGKKNYLRSVGQKGHRTEWEQGNKNPDSLPEPLTPKQKNTLLHLGDISSGLVEDRYGIVARCVKRDGVWRQIE